MNRRLAGFSRRMNRRLAGFSRRMNRRLAGFSRRMNRRLAGFSRRMNRRALFLNSPDDPGNPGFGRAGSSPLSLWAGYAGPL